MIDLAIIEAYKQQPLEKETKMTILSKCCDAETTSDDHEGGTGQCTCCKDMCTTYEGEA